LSHFALFSANIFAKIRLNYKKENKMKKIKLLPKTILGICSIVLIVATPMCFYIGASFVSFYKSVPAGKTIPQDILVRPGVALSMLTGFACSLAAFFGGLIAILKKKDFSLLVFLSTLLGFFMFLFLLAEIIFPH
jgi:hypothetical protein